MKIVIVSDIHANHDAWIHFPEKNWDELWVLGDTVNFGPEPELVLDSVRKMASIAVMGNHDHAVVHNDDQHWGEKFRDTASAMRQFTSTLLSNEQVNYLAGLPLFSRIKRDGKCFYLVHAIPSNPLYGHLTPTSAQWESELIMTEADILITGHTHVPFIRNINGKIILNPGSIGQPRDGNTLASYAVWENGAFTLRRYFYPVDSVLKKIANLPLEHEHKDAVSRIMISGLK